MTPQEKTIWNAAYAAAFARRFDGDRRAVGFDRAASFEGDGLCSSEFAVAVADLAVIALRRWRADENPVAGVLVGDKE